MVELKIKTPIEFSKEIEDLVWEKDIEYIDAVLLYCEKNNIELETAASLIKLNQNLKSRVREEAEELNFLAKTTRLPDV